jgi:outer membrane protein TolC
VIVTTWRRLSMGALVAALALPPVAHAQDAAHAQGERLGATVEGLLQAARARNPEIAGLRFDADAAAERVLPAGALPDPRFRTELRDITRAGEQTASFLPGRVGSTRYLLMQDLPWFGKRELKREVAASQAETASGRTAASWNELAGKIKATYAQLYYLEQNERLNKEILDFMARLEKIAQARYASGLAAQQDVIRAQLEQSAARGELIALNGERQQLHARMNALLGRSATDPLATPARLRPLPAPENTRFDVLAQRARANNPLLRAEESQIKTAEKTRDLTYSNRYPDFTVGVAPIQYQGAIREWDLMVELNIPLQQASRRAQERESDAQLAAARSRRDGVANQILAELHEQVAGLEAARQSLALTTDSLLPQSELTFRSALAGYSAGKVDFATVLDAQRQIRQARLNQVKAGTAAQLRLVEIERLVGEEP